MRMGLLPRLLGTFLLIIAILAGVGLLISGHARATAAAYQRSVSNLVRVVELTRAVDAGAQALAAAPAQGAAAFAGQRDQIHRLRRDLPAATSRAGARLVQDLDGMADSFLVEAGAALYALRDGNMDLYFQHDREAAAIAGYVRDTADRLLAAELEHYRQIYPEVLRRERDLQNSNLAVLAAVSLLAAVFGWSFARGVTSPLQALARAAGRIAAGDLYGPPVPGGGGAELAMLGSAFNHMQANLQRQVAELQAMADLERRLRAEERARLQIRGLLREAELRALQSQVNPHFLFNTLNMVAKTALIENAERTATLLETVADLLRYSLRPPDQPVTLAAEVAQVQRYMTIQQGRFRDRLQFAAELDPAALATPIPCLTLQPLVENALIHGLGAREEGGTVRLTVARRADRVLVTVADDGAGMAPERLAALAAAPPADPGPVDPGAPPAAGGHTTGLGLQNVRRRLDLFTGGSARFHIASQPGQGTTVTLDLPAAPEGETDRAHPGGR